MTDEQAYSEALKRWGTRAWVSRGPLSPSTPDITVCRAGKVADSSEGEKAITHGIGSCWEEAFTIADSCAHHRSNGSVHSRVD